MIIDVALSRVDLARLSPFDRAVVVIDIIRASTTITIALHHGCVAVVPARTLAEARVVARTLGNGAMLAGEREAARVAGFELGNSPAEYSRARIEGKVIVMSTSNGTRVFRAVDGARGLIACAFLNVSAAARWLKRTGLDVLIVPAGQRGGFAFEDTVGAGMLVDRLLEISASTVKPGDTARAAHLLYGACRNDLLGMLQGCEWGRTITRKGFGADLEVCAKVDLTDVVPVMREGRLVAERA